MIASSTLQFLEQLKEHNEKNWFDAHRTAYESARQNVASFAADVLKELSKTDEGFAQLEPKDTMFRINRDVRFSANKLPYKTNLGAYFCARGKKADFPGYYLQVEPGKCFAAAGLWMPAPPVLAAIRQEIDYNFEDLQQILESPLFKTNFQKGLMVNESLRRPPKGYDESNPAIGLLKLKNFVVSKSYTDQQVISGNFLKEFLNTCRAATPLIEFLKQALH